MADVSGGRRRQPDVVRFEAASIGHRGVAILREVSFTIESGQLWVFLGREGSGKTTLARAAMGLVVPMEGSIGINAAFSSRARIGYVPRAAAVAWNLPTTVREIVSLGLVGMPAGDIDEHERIAGALEKVGLGGAQRSSVRSLTAEQRQQVLVARALARHPRFLVADEPTRGLDDAADDRLLRKLAALNDAERLTIALATDDVGIAGRYATHVALLVAGTVKAGTRSQVLTKENIRAAYADASATNAFTAHAQATD